MRRRLCATLVALSLNLAVPALAQDGTDPPCPNPTPTAVAVTTVPIVVPSTTAEYFVLYVKHTVDGTERELPVAVKVGEAGTTTLSENIAALPVARYRVEKYLVADPADVDGDCIDDLTELADPKGNPVNPAKALALSDGAIIIPDHATFEALASGFALKFVVVDLGTDRPGVYFMNTNKYPAHEDFLKAVGLVPGEGYYAHITYRPSLRASDGSAGVYLLFFNAYSARGRLGLRTGVTFPFSMAAHAYTLLAASVPLLDDNLGLFIPNSALPAI